jgi:HK97 family phage major capsid protein
MFDREIIGDEKKSMNSNGGIKEMNRVVFAIATINVPRYFDGTEQPTGAVMKWSELEPKLDTKITNIVENVMKTYRTEIAAENKTNLEAMVKEGISMYIKTTAPNPTITAEENYEKDGKRGFKCLSHFCRDVAWTERKMNPRVSENLQKWVDWTNKVDKAAGTGMQEMDQEFGGVLVPPEFRNNLLLAIEQENLVVPRCTPVPMERNIVEIPYVQGFDNSGGLVYGGIVWKWIDEEGQYDETRPKLARIQMKLKKVVGLAYASEEIISDSPTSMEGLLRRGFQDGLNYQFNYVTLRGTGAGQPLGVLNAPCKVAISKENGQNPGTILFENIVNMYSRCFNPGRAIWMANPDTLPQLSTMSVVVGTAGVPVWMPANGISGSPYPTLYGLPVVFNDHCSAVGTEGDIILADWSQYLLGQKSGGEGVRFDTSIHLKFDYGQTAFRFMIRLDGMPWWKTPYTPPQSTTKTRSPFITLETRS